MSHEEPPATLIEFCWERSLPEQAKQVKRWKSLIGFLDLAHFGSIFNQKNMLSVTSITQNGFCALNITQ
jgi:hypothetical protein